MKKFLPFLFILWATTSLAQPVNSFVQGPAAVAGSTCFAKDVFAGTNGTNLTAHSDDLGNTWAQAGGLSNNALIDTSTTPNSARGNAVGVIAFYKDSGTPPSADYSVQFTLFSKSTLAGVSLSAVGRISNSDADFYRAVIISNTSLLQLFKSVGGVATQLGSNFSYTPTTGDVIKLVMTGTTIKVNLNGTDVITQTDGAVTVAGVTGFRWNSSSTDGPWVQNFKAYATTAC